MHIQKKKPKAFMKMSHFRSIRMSTLREELHVLNERKELIELDLPTYDMRLEVSFHSADLSINCVMLSLLSIAQVMSAHVTGDVIDITYDVYKELKECLECGTHTYDIKNDVECKLLTATSVAVEAITPHIQFWRVD
eukprot:TRINITY_DN5553_c0_g1_i1.p1 TRINITY_DN5553_c0_g1~~TRINITY_DN5553_c0_g1_i1.p1  ORF type:complete len:137 (-),score=32.66 TRINITY_DN5553_c0_g1_i1:254-664(-)